MSFSNDFSNRIMDPYLFYENHAYVRQFLMDKYRKLDLSNNNTIAYRNTETFTSYVQQAHIQFKTAHLVDLTIKPLMLYYGAMNLIKAYLLTVDPDYPRSSAVLQHGLSTRKKKKIPFLFLQDEIRIQKEGLFPLFMSYLNPSISVDHRYHVKDLLSFIPDMQDSYHFLLKEQTLVPIEIMQQEPTSKRIKWRVHETILDRVNLTPTSYESHLNRFGHYFKYASSTSPYIYYTWQHHDSLSIQHPWFVKNKQGDYLLWIQNNHLAYPLPQVATQFMLLFSLSMLCRYDTPLWRDVILGNWHTESILVRQAIELVMDQWPRLIFDLMH
ncbi:hypothetical protein IC620_06280 [Hazenella sp. IB182357]|uniref:YaaC-like Protein n=1 Tax=Polycladospora coralii TaxID=2771432 RepID=A0A926NAD4_9BACL|nr:YaaC family protein [Polycladospora coralii]MBD1371965.1 hypothetical protein [Polycladospora coralii]